MRLNSPTCHLCPRPAFAPGHISLPLCDGHLLLAQAAARWGSWGLAELVAGFLIQPVGLRLGEVLELWQGVGSREGGPVRVAWKSSKPGGRKDDRKGHAF